MREVATNNNYYRAHDNYPILSRGTFLSKADVILLFSRAQIMNKKIN
jgi:hypothetical protein